MGYETTLHIANLFSDDLYEIDGEIEAQTGYLVDYGYTNQLEEGQVGYASAAPIATIDLAKCGHKTRFGKLNAEAIAKAKDSTHRRAIYGDDGDHLIVRDRYDDPPAVMELGPVLEAMKADQADEPYRRFQLAIALLEQFTDKNLWPYQDRLAVITYGH